MILFYSTTGWERVIFIFVVWFIWDIQEKDEGKVSFKTQANKE